MKIAAIQMVSSTDLNHNITVAKTLLKKAAELGAHLAVLPENFSMLAGHKEHPHVETYGASSMIPIQAMLAQAAQDLGIWIVAGSIPLAGEDSQQRFFNASLVYNPKGECVARYDKIHLFQFDNGREHYDEHSRYLAGKTPRFFMLDDPNTHQKYKVGLSICYDLRFPELYRQLCVPDPCDLILVPAAFTYTTGKAHWEILLRARAIENQCYFLASAQGGQHANGRTTWGHSMIIDPWGTILCAKAFGEGVITAEIDLIYLHHIRTQLPAMRNRVLQQHN